jgi:hypothetical protein
MMIFSKFEVKDTKTIFTTRAQNSILRKVEILLTPRKNCLPKKASNTIGQVVVLLMQTMRATQNQKNSHRFHYTSDIDFDFGLLKFMCHGTTFRHE